MVSKVKQRQPDVATEIFPCGHSRKVHAHESSMNTNNQKLSLTERAEKILASHAAVLSCDENMAEQKQRKIRKAISCGKHLIEAKKMMDHGQWRSWLADNCKGICFKTATNYMRLTDANRQHVADLSKAKSLRQAYIAAGIISKPERPEPSDFVKAKGLAVQLWNLLAHTTDAERMAKEIEAVVLWHQEYTEQRRKREAALNDGFDDVQVGDEPKLEAVV